MRTTLQAIGNRQQAIVGWRNCHVFAIACCLFPIASIANANDSAMGGVGGTAIPMKGEHRSIAMESEKIVIVTNDDQTYDTRVDFIFRNDGGRASVQMGFPEGDYTNQELAQKSDFSRFATWVDGRRVPVKRRVSKQTNSNGNVNVYWLKTVAFERHQRRRVRVEYRAPMGSGETWGSAQTIPYSFTGGNWKGKVKKSELEIRLSQAGLWVGLPFFGNKTLRMDLKTKTKSAVFRKTWHNWQAQGDFTLCLMPIVPFWMWDKELLKDSDEDVNSVAATTFRVGAVPKELPQDTVPPSAFIRNGVAYIALSGLKSRLHDFADDLKKQRNRQPSVDVEWNAKSGVATLIAGQKTLHFARYVGSPAPILLRSKYGPTLYVPLAPVAKTLGLTFKIKPEDRLFELRRGTWMGK